MLRLAPTLDARPVATMTFLFTDIEGSTRQWEESWEMSERVERHFVALRAAVGQAGGSVFSTMGDGIAAAFPTVEGAIRAAIAAQRELAVIGLAVRMGIHTGEVVRIGDDFRGRAVNRAARIMAVGHGGQILLSDVAAAIARAGSGAVELRDLGRHQLRDLTEPEHLWQVVHPDLVTTFPPVRGVDTFAHNLPVQRTPLVGRGSLLQQVVTLVQRHRLVTLTGVGGVGKTRVAVHAAAEMLTDFGATWFVDLARIDQPDDVIVAIAGAVGLAGASDALDATAAALGGSPRLLVVDNCEHVLDGVAAAIDSLIASCRELTVLATSRERLDVDGEHVVIVPPLDAATAAVELFGQRAVAAGVDPMALDPVLLADLCRRLDGIPLAIELAAARAGAFGLVALGDALDDRLGFSSGAARRRGGTRQGTLRATIEWSYRLLDGDEQRMFRSLAVFPSGFELDAVMHVAAALGLPAAPTDLIESLVHKSMVTLEPHAEAARYRLLETMREYARERLDESGERGAASLALASWVRSVTDLPYNDPCNSTVERHCLRLEREADTWREAVITATTAGDPELAAALCGPPVAFFLLGRHHLADVVRPLVELCAADPRHHRAVLTALIVSASGGTGAAQLQQWAEAVQRIDEAAPTGLGGLMRWLALAWRGDFPASIEVCVAASLDGRLRQATRDMFVGIAVLDHFSLTDAARDTYGLIPRALEVAERSNVALHRATCLLGAAWGLAGADPDRALHLVRRASAEIPGVPALTRMTLPGSAARLLARLDPQVAARGLLDQLDATSSRSSFVDLIPLFYAATLVDGLGAGSAEALSITVTAAPTHHRSMMDFVDLARRAARDSGASSIAELERTVRAALSDIAA